MSPLMKISITGDKISDSDQKTFSGEEENVLTLGAFSYINGLDLWLGAENYHSVLIGRYCSLSHGLLFLVARNHDYKAVTTYHEFGSSNFRAKNPCQIIIGHDVWIGHGVTILGGVKIGNGAVIGAKSVVAKDIPPYAIAVGNPARVIKYRFDEATIKKLLAVKWWNWDKEKVKAILSKSPAVEKFLAEYYSPEFENLHEDNFSSQLKKFNGNIYHFVTDFQADKPLWKKVLNDFCRANLQDAVLIIWLGKDATEEDKNSIFKAIDFGSNIIVHEKNFSPAAIRLGTHFITTRESITLEALDYLWNTDIKIISALDKNIFSG